MLPGVLLKSNGNGCAFSRCAFQGDLCLMISRCVLDDGKTQAGAAGCLGVALVHPVEPLKDPVLMLGRNADAGITDGELFVFNMNFYGSTRDVILDGIVTEIVNYLV